MSFVPFLRSEGFISSKEILTFIKIGNNLQYYQDSVIGLNNIYSYNSTHTIYMFYITGFDK